MDETLTELKRRAAAQETLPTIAALEALQQKYRGRTERIEPTPVRLAKDFLRKPFRPIHPIVDVYNMWSAAGSACGLAVSMWERFAEQLRLRITNGNERFQPLGADQSEKLVEPGGFAYIDDSGEVLCWLDVRDKANPRSSQPTRGGSSY